MSNHRVATIPEERRQRLLATAASEFAAHGYEQASLNRIVRACGMSKSSFYHYVDSKAALFDAVIELSGRALASDLSVPDPDTFIGPDFWNHIDRLGQRLSDLSTQKQWYVDFGKLIYLPDAPVDESPALARVTSIIREWLERIIDTGQRTGAIRDDLPHSLLIALTHGVVRALDEWSVTHMDELDPVTLASITSRQVEMLQRLLAPGKEHGPR